MLVFKILHTDEWQAAQAARVYRGSADDKRDGFIHLSTAAQLAGTLNRHFAQATGLMLVALDADNLGDKLKWEANSQGENFPHLYSDLELSRVLWTSTIPNKAPGVFALPARAFAEQPQAASRLS
ncbi:MAG TPA: DUF952 domain-containing protein [Nitrobacter sp.]|nr:DUF952 domain-containing protein [Nitrobacter sp.]